MKYSRRKSLHMLSSSAASISMFTRPVVANGAGISVRDYMPHAAQDTSAYLSKSPKLVLALWQYFPISFDNKPKKFDYYTTQLMTVEGEKGKHRDYGGFIRDRPIPMDPIPLRNWQVEFARRDIAFAIAAGIDAFLFNISSIDAKQGYLKNLEYIFQAINLENSRFRVAPCIDAVAISSQQPVDEIVAAILPFLKRDGALQSNDGRPVLSSFAAERWEVTRWKEILQGFAAHGVHPVFRPLFLMPKEVTRSHLELVDALGWWAGNHIDGIEDLRHKAREASSMAKGFIWPIWPQDCRPRSGWFAEARNSELFRAGWAAAISEEVDWICILTWNDYAETSHIRPSVGTQYAFADLNRFFSDWFKISKQPAIVNNVLFYFHRRDFTGQQYSADQTRRPLELRLGASPCDELEIVCFLTEAGTLMVRSGPTTSRFDVAQGIQVCRVALNPGSQMVEFHSATGKDKILMSSPFFVRPLWDWQDLTYRGGSSAREPVIGANEFSLK